MNRTELLEALKSNIGRERRGQAQFLGYLSEVDERRLYLPEYPSLFEFCMEVLGLSDPSSSKRIQLARLSRKFPVVLELIGEGKLTMTNASLLARHLTEENHEKLLQQAQGKRKFEVERLVASIAPKPDVPDSVRPLPPTFASEGKPSYQPPPRRDVIKPLSEKSTKFAFCGDDETLAMYRTLQDRFRHTNPKGEMGILVKEAFKLLLEKTDPAREPERKVSPKPPAKHSRYVPEGIRRVVWQRDGGMCRQELPSGKRCKSTAFLELDHIIPWSLGGSSHDANNLRLLCRAHNQLKGGAGPGNPPRYPGTNQPGRNPDWGMPRPKQ
jgi:hypothetical protein